MTPRVLAFAGSLRRESFNKKLIGVGAQAARDAGADVTHIDLRDFPLPIYDADIEMSDGIPEPAQKLQAMFREHHALLIACPEYNSSITPLLKNTIDWITRIEPGKGSIECFDGKVAGLLAASPGGLGGLRGLFHVREILQNIRTTVVPDIFALSGAGGAFNEDGSLKDETHAKKVRAVAESVVATAKRMHA